MELRKIILQYLITTTLPMLQTGSQIPTVFRPRSEHLPDLMASSLFYIMFGFSGSVWVTGAENQVKLGFPISHINLWFQNELKISHTTCQHKTKWNIKGETESNTNIHLQGMRVFKDSIEFKVNHKQLWDSFATMLLLTMPTVSCDVL